MGHFKERSRVRGRKCSRMRIPSKRRDNIFLRTRSRGAHGHGQHLAVQQFVSIQNKLGDEGTHGLGGHSRLVARERFPEHGRVHGTQAEAIASDGGVFQFLGQAFGHTGQRGLARTIAYQTGELGASLETAHAADVHHMRGCAAAQSGQERLCQHQRASGVRSEEVVQLIRRPLPE
jgi:hypothetical protein